MEIFGLKRDCPARSTSSLFAPVALAAVLADGPPVLVSKGLTSHPRSACTAPGADGS